MAKLNLSANIPDPDGFYATLLASHENLGKDESDAFNARLILILANHIGNRKILDKALAVAARSGSTK